MGQQIWATNSLGGFFSNNELSKKIRHAAQPMMKFRQFVDPEPASGKNRGNIVYFDKISNISTVGGTLVETDTIPKRNFTIRQGTLTITEYGNSIPFTLKAQTLADVSVPDNVKIVLRNDMAKVLDSAVASIFTAGDYKATVVNTATTSFSTTGTATATALGDMSDKNVRDVIDRLKKLNVPRYDGGNFICIASTNSIRGLYDFFEPKVSQTSAGVLASGEIGEYYGCRFIEETSFLSNVKGSNSIYGEAVFFGADAVREGIAVPENIRIDIPKDFGRDQGIAWYYLGGFVETWDFSADSETRIITLTSLSA
jgi:N4-gp56 family major capsid protein